MFKCDRFARFFTGFPIIPASRRKGNLTGFGTITAGGAFRGIDVTRISANFYTEIALLPGNGLYIGKREDFDVFVRRTFFQFRRQCIQCGI